MFGHKKFPCRMWGSNLGPLAPVASALTTELQPTTLFHVNRYDAVSRLSTATKSVVIIKYSRCITLTKSYKSANKSHIFDVDDRMFASSSTPSELLAR